jgi:signal transduction histidine kinase
MDTNTAVLVRDLRKSYPGVTAVELITSGYGLRGMRDRVAQVGGTIQVTSAPGAGTQVCAEVPG